MMGRKIGVYTLVLTLVMFQTTGCRLNMSSEFEKKSEAETQSVDSLSNHQYSFETLPADWIGYELPEIPLDSYIDESEDIVIQEENDSSQTKEIAPTNEPTLDNEYSESNTTPTEEKSYFPSTGKWEEDTTDLVSGDLMGE